MMRIELISVVVAVTKEVDDIAAAYRSYRPVLARFGKPVGVHLRAGRASATGNQALRALKAAGEPIEILSFASQFGEAAALTVGFRHAAGDVVFTLTPQVEVAPAALPQLLEALDGSDLVVARRIFGTGQQPPRQRKLDRTINALFGTSLQDIRCGVRAMRAEVAKELTIYGNQHRFLPLLAQAQGFSVREIDLPAERPGRAAVAAKSAGRQPAARRGDDLFPAPLSAQTVPLLRRLRLCRPGRWRSVHRLSGDRPAGFGVPLVDRPALVLSTLMVVLGIQILSVGLIGEIVAFTYAKDIKDYRVDRVVEPPDEPEPAERPAGATDLAVARRA